MDLFSMYKNRVCWTRFLCIKTKFNKLGFYKLKSSLLDLISFWPSTCPAADRTQNSNSLSQNSKLSKQTLSHSLPLSLSLSLSLLHTFTPHSASLRLSISLRLSLSLRLAPSPSLWLRHRPSPLSSLSLRLSVSFHLCPLAPLLSPFHSIAVAIPIMAFWQWFLSQQSQGIILICSLLCGFWVFISLYEWLFGLFLCFREMGCCCWFCLFTVYFVLFFFGCNVNWVECLNWRLMGFWIFFFIKWLLLLLLLLYISVIWNESMKLGMHNLCLPLNRYY